MLVMVSVSGCNQISEKLFQIWLAVRIMKLTFLRASSEEDQHCLQFDDKAYQLVEIFLARPIRLDPAQL